MEREREGKGREVREGGSDRETTPPVKLSLSLPVVSLLPSLSRQMAPLLLMLQWQMRVLKVTWCGGVEEGVRGKRG